MSYNTAPSPPSPTPTRISTNSGTHRAIGSRSARTANQAPHTNEDEDTEMSEFPRLRPFPDLNQCKTPPRNKPIPAPFTDGGEHELTDSVIANRSVPIELPQMPTPNAKNHVTKDGETSASPGEVEELLAPKTPQESEQTATSDQQSTPVDPNKPLLDILEEFSSLAEIEEGLGAFHISDFTIEPITITPTTESTKRAAIRDQTQWVPIYRKDLEPSLLHLSSNPLDCMSTHLINECIKEKNNKPNKLSPEKKLALIRPGYKLLLKVFSNDANGNRLPRRDRNEEDSPDLIKLKSDWCTHAIRSALQTNNIPMSNALTTLSLGRPNFDWYQIILTKEAFKVLSGIRALIDPRSRVMILLRPWDTHPTDHPIIRFEGITTATDSSSEAKEHAINTFKTQLGHSLNEHKITISVIDQISEPKGKVQTDYVDVHFTFDNREPVTIRPNIFPSTYNGPDGTRKIKASWTRPCRHCLSESHPKSTNSQCPWLTTKLPNNLHPSDTNYSVLRPGQTERRQKRKQDEDDQIIDLRPADKKRKKEDERKEGKETDESEEKRDTTMSEK